MRYLLTAGLILILVVACGRNEQQSPVPQSTLTWYGSVKAAEEEAQEAGDLMLLSFEAGWCPWSRLTRESLYVNEEVVESLAVLRCVRVDADSDSNLVREFGVTIYPTVVLTDAYRCELGRIVGYHLPGRFLERLTYLKSREDVLAEMFRQEEASVDDPTFLVALGKALAEMGMYEGALIRFDRASRIDSDDRYGTLEEADYSLAETYMLAGEAREAGRRFRLFANSHPSSDRVEHALVLAALCYQEAGYMKVTKEIYGDYLESFESGEFSAFVRSRLDSLNRSQERAG
jgi:tetratricopeptide (TPR) repeat protein